MSPSDPDISFFRLPRTADRQSIEQFAVLLRTRVAKGGAFACRVTTDAELQRLNRTFRRKDYATDVLSFPAPAGPVSPEGSQQNGYLGDLAISWQRARAQALEYGHSLETELRVLMLHGVLHLMGLDHETDNGRMSRAETRWRRSLGLPAGLIERVSA
jgi:probable rRNA maturation factor